MPPTRDDKTSGDFEEPPQKEMSQRLISLPSVFSVA